MASSIGELALVAHKFITIPQANPQTFCGLTQNCSELVVNICTWKYLNISHHHPVSLRNKQSRNYIAKTEIPGVGLGIDQGNVIKLGTFVRTVVWPCLPPLLMYQYIRGKDEDMYAIEVLYHKSGSSEPKAFWDASRLKGSGHWRMMQDLEAIRAAANAE